MVRQMTVSGLTMTQPNRQPPQSFDGKDQTSRSADVAIGDFIERRALARLSKCSVA